MKRSVLSLSCVIALSLCSLISHAQWSTATLSGARTLMGAAAANGVAIFAGGIGMISQPPGVYDLYNSTSGLWSSGGFSPPRCKLAGVSCGSYLLFAGGANDWILSEYDNVNIYNTLSNSWSTSNALSAPRAYLSGASAGSKVVFAGGESGGLGLYSDAADIFDTLSQTWTDTQISSARSRMAAAGAGTKILFAGGENAGTVFRTVDVYDVVSNTWTVDSLSVGRRGMCGVSNGNKIYFAGGVTQGNQVTNRIDIYDVNTGTWTIDSLSQARHLISAAAVGDLVIFAGGSNFAGNTAYNTVDILNTVTGTWTTSTLATARYDASAVSTGGKFIMAGGAGASGMPLSSAEIYTVTSTGQMEVNLQNQLQVFPNPASGFVTIRNSNDSQRILEVELFDQTGRLVYTQDISSGSEEIILDLESIPAGIYMLSVYTDDGKIMSSRLTVQ